MKAKKSLGQNFLHAKAVLDDIISASHISPEDTVLEIGPGMGSLTEKLLETGATVVCIEKDDRLIPELTSKFEKEINEKKLTLIHGDVLEFDTQNILPRSYKLVANIPYYITGLIIRKFLETPHPPQSTTLLVQKEVADRIIARDGKESLLSLSVKAYGEPRYIRTVGKGAFNPPPSIDSAVIVIENISKNKLNGIDEKFFFEVLHAGFAHKRKLLSSNLSNILDKTLINSAFESTHIPTNTRAEDLNIEQWIALSNSLKRTY